MTDGYLWPPKNRGRLTGIYVFLYSDLASSGACLCDTRGFGWENVNETQRDTNVEWRL